MKSSRRGICYRFGVQGPAIKGRIEHRHVLKYSLSERVLNCQQDTSIAAHRQAQHLT